jgi:lipopolysaccharide/colanic/teichoic acid biosynthesis glycosyltransferase
MSTAPTSTASTASSSRMTKASSPAKLDRRAFVLVFVLIFIILLFLIILTILIFHDVHGLCRGAT